MATSEILNFTKAPIVDEGIERFKFHEYEPVSCTNLNSAGEIRINIQALFTLTSEAYLMFEGRLTKTDNGAYANTDAVTLTNNGLMYLFSQISTFNEGAPAHTEAFAAVISDRMLQFQSDGSKMSVVY